MNGQVFNDRNFGWGVFDDFLDLFATANRYTLTEGDAAASIGLIATEVGGVLRMTTGAVDNNEANIISGINEGVLGKINTGTGKVWFECKWRPSSVTDNAAGYLIGLAEEGSGGANLQTDNTGVVADKDFVGFSVVQADGNALTGIHNTSGGGGVTTLISSAAVPVADTWIRTGFYFDGLTTTTFYVDGVALSTTVEYDATNFPNGEELAFVAGVKTGSATSINLDIDWWAFAQEAA